MLEHDIDGESEPFLGESARAFLRRRMDEFWGLATFAVAGIIALSLATYSPFDPSINHATGAAPRNWLGQPGADLADLLVQTLGLGAWLIVMTLAAWAARLMAHRPVTWFWLRLSVLPLAVIAAALFAASLPRPDNWALAAGPGGVVGDLLYRWVALAAVHAGFSYLPTLYSVASGGLAFLLAIAVFGLRSKDWLTAGRGLADGAGAVAKGATQLARTRQPQPAPVKEKKEAWWRRLLAKRKQAAQPSGTARERGREPVFGGMDEQPFTPATREPATPLSRVRKEPLVAEDEDDLAVEEAPKKRVTPRAPKPEAGKRAAAESQAALDLGTGEFQLPPLALLAVPKQKAPGATYSEESLEQNARLLESVLDDFGVRGEIINVRPGPVVTLYELEPAPGLKSSRVIGLADDIARSMSAVSARVAVIPGRNVIGIELPNAHREMVFLRELLASKEYESSQSRLTLALGKDIGGHPVMADLAKMPHLLVAGTTGSGKSVAINTMILSLLYRQTPKDCRLIMIDPKMLELSVYDGIPHLLAPVVTDPKKAVVALKWTVREMEDRYRKMSKLGVRNVAGFNQKVEELLASGEQLTRTVQTGFDKLSGEPIFEEQTIDLSPMPMIVVIVDEMADLMMVAGKDIEGAIQRLAQMARAAGIHLIMATQRPSVDVITGTIKANFPTRISFQVTSRIDSRTILGEQGAEQLLGQGDMLYMAGGGRIGRVHGPFVSDDEVEKVVSFLKAQGAPDYVESVTDDPEDGEGGMGLGGEDGEGEGENSLYDKAVAIVVRDQKASTSYVQRRLGIGYNRAASLIERMEAEGVIGQANHAGKREVLVPDRG